jgi:EAL domain-containing protein (putative c-di-GMP-specific phosphodiesterase class I)
VARAIVSSTVQLARELGTVIIAEGIETMDEYAALRDCGVSLMQGYLFARPAFEALPGVTFPALETAQHVRSSPPMRVLQPLSA